MKDTYIPAIEANRSRVCLSAILSRRIESIEDVLRNLNGGEGDKGSVQRFVGKDGENSFFAQAKCICDAVIIVVPIPLLGFYVEKCLQVGLHIISEKPISMTSGDASRLSAFYRQQQQLRPDMGLWHVAENYRLESAIVYASQLVREHSCKPKSFALTCLRQQSTTAKYAVTEWRSKPAYHGSFVLDGGIHFVSLLRLVMNAREVTDIQCQYEEQSYVEVGTCGSCRLDGVLGTVHIRYGAFPQPICRLEVFFDDAVISVTQLKGIGYEVTMTGKETRQFGSDGLEVEFDRWVDSLFTSEPIAELQPEEGLIDLLVVEGMCNTNKLTLG